MAELIDEIVASENVLSPGEMVEPRTAPTGSVFYGAAGVALALAELSTRCGRPEWLTVARGWAETAARSTDPEAFFATQFFGSHQTPSDRSFHHGPAGAHLAVAACAALQGDLAGIARSVDHVARIASSDTHIADTDASIDAMVGPVSLLSGLCALIEVIDNSTGGSCDERLDDATIEHDVSADVVRLARTLVVDGIDRLDPSVVTRPIRHHTQTNLGAAHGWAGLLDTVMRAAVATGIEAPDWVGERAEELASFSQVRAGRAFWPVAAGHPVAGSGGWCNGSAGHVSMWCRRYAITGDERDLDLARSAASAAVAESSPVHNLCCGSAGRALAALTLFRATNDDRWIESAETSLSEAAALRGVRSAVMLQLQQVPRSVYKGELGVALAASALIEPERPVAFFP